MPERIRVGDVMTRNFVYVKPDDSIHKCAKTMNKGKIGSVLVKEGDELKGIVSMHDIVWAISKKKGKDLQSVTVKDIATKKIVTIKPEATLDEALQKMSKKRVKRLPVIVNKKIVGYITLRDMLKFRPSLFDTLQESYQIREEAEKIIRSQSAMRGEFLEAPCEGCGNFDVLEETVGQMLCESCRGDL
jgi:CBS domain-containing protein/ribosomal protein S27E